MRLILYILIFTLLSPLLYKNVQAVEIVNKSNETINKIKTDTKNVLKKLSKTSLKENEIKIFLSEYVITIDDERGDGLVTYYFNEKVYKRYKDLELISEDKWKVSYLDKKLKIFYGKNKITWKIQPGKKNIINIKKNITSIGKSYEFFYQSKTDYHVSLEEKKIKN